MTQASTRFSPIGVRGHMRASSRLARLMLHVLAGSLVMAFLIPISRLRGRPTPPTAWWYRDAVRLYGIRVDYPERPPVSTACLVVANHISWMDIIILGSSLPTVFVSKSSVRNWPLIGWYAKQFGTIFLERGKHQTQTVGEAIAEGLRKGVSVVVFPEGTTGSNTRPNRFYPRLFSGAVNAGAPVLPAALAYPDAEGSGINPEALFIDDEPFLNSVWRTLAQRRTDVVVRLGEPIPSSDSGRNALAARSHAAVCALLDEVIPDDREADREQGRS